jgi:hypothetical protein
MPKRKWSVLVGGQRIHEVQVNWSWWTGSGHLAVDGNIVDTWGPFLFGLTKRFQIEGQPAILQSTGLFSSGWDLYVGGKKACRR